MIKIYYIYIIPFFIDYVKRPRHISAGASFDYHLEMPVIQAFFSS